MLPTLAAIPFWQTPLFWLLAIVFVCGAAFLAGVLWIIWNCRVQCTRQELEDERNSPHWGHE